ncbi:MAG: major facilitator superfamily 1 [Dactylosporangium sp.]|jgi:MFS family permease|nr:major facilitator superfamily 1 [Dactylosporangium sp.]
MTSALPAEVARARIGTTATFGLAGALCAVWTVRIPALTDKLHLSPASVGTTVLVWGITALIAMQLTQRAVARLGSRRTLLFTAPASALLSAGIGIAPTYAWLLVAAALFGTAFGALDIGMNAQVAVLERRSGRHLMNGAHAGWSMGSVFGGGLGALSAYLHLTFAQTLVGMAMVGLPVALALLPTYVADPPQSPPQRGRPPQVPAVIYLIGAVTCAAFVIEGSVADWSGLYLRDELGAREAVAALAYPCFEAAMIVGRVFGDRVRRRITARTMLTGAGVAAAAAFVVVVVAPHWWVALLGFFLVGLAICTVVPLTFSIAGALDSTGAAIAKAGAMGYGGMLVGPVAIGYLANVTSLRVGLLVSVALALVTAVLGRVAGSVETRVPAESNASRSPVL